MYDELIKDLREWPRVCVEYTGSVDELHDKAADAIEELSRKVEDYETRLELTPEAQYAIDKHADDLIDRMDKLIEGLNEKPRWIPVTERLPYTMKDKSVYSGWSAEIAPSDDVLCYLESEKRQAVAWYSHTY